VVQGLRDCAWRQALSEARRAHFDMVMPGGRFATSGWTPSPDPRARAGEPNFRELEPDQQLAEVDRCTPNGCVVRETSSFARRRRVNDRHSSRSATSGSTRLARRAGT
jgi:hypothetical protein